MIDQYPGFSHSSDHQNPSYGNRVATNSAKKDREVAEKRDSIYSNCYSSEGTLQFRPNPRPQSMEIDDSGVDSPPLWKNIQSPPKSPSHPLLSQYKYRTSSQKARAEAIARGQWEIMEMVKNLPESSYELSLKDIVEHHKTETQTHESEETLLSNRRSLHRKGEVNVKIQENKSTMRRESLENNGLFLNMVFPFSIKSKKKKNFAGSKCGGVSPRAEGLKGGGERDWWKKKFTGSSDSDSSRVSSNSRSSGGSGSKGGSSSSQRYVSDRKRNGSRTGCWSFFRSSGYNSVE